MEVEDCKVCETLSTGNRKIYNVVINENNSPNLFFIFFRDLENKNNENTLELFPCFLLLELQFSKTIL